MSNKGWVKIDRGLLDHELWSAADPFDIRSAWIDLILMANHKDAKIFGGAAVKRGDVNRSIMFLAERWRWSRGKVRRFLSKLVREQMVTVNSTTNGTTITLINYDKYQISRPTNEPSNGHQTDRQRTADGHIQEYIKNDKNGNTEEEGDARARGSGFSFLLDKGEYELTEDQLDELIRRYPELDVRREMIRISEWCADNPGKRKAEVDAWRFVTGWMTRSSKEAAAPLVMKPSAPKNSFHNFAERGESLEALFSGDIVSEEGA